MTRSPPNPKKQPRKKRRRPKMIKPKLNQQLTFKHLIKQLQSLKPKRRKNLYQKPQQ
jgi:hypothetical protein